MIGNRIYNKIHNWLLPMPEQECDVIPVSQYHYFSPSPFQKVILDYLTWFGVDEKGNITRSRVYPSGIEIAKTVSTLRQCGFKTVGYIEKLAVSEFLEMKSKIPDLDLASFVYYFEGCYHNFKVVKWASIEAQKSNNLINTHYNSIKRFLIEIQDFIKPNDLRTRIEFTFTETNNWNNFFKVQEFITSFCKIALDCDELGRFSMTYFINPHLKELIGESLGDTLEKRFEELTNSEVKDFVKELPLNRRYDKWFKEAQALEKYKITVTERNSL